MAPFPYFQRAVWLAGAAPPRGRPTSSARPTATAQTTVTSSATAAGQCVTRHLASRGPRAWSRVSWSPSSWWRCPPGPQSQGSRATLGRGGGKVVLLSQIKYLYINCFSIQIIKKICYFQGWCINRILHFYQDMYFLENESYHYAENVGWENVRGFIVKRRWGGIVFFWSPVFHSIKMLAAEHL